MTYRYGAKRVCGPNALSPGSYIVYFERCVIVIHCWCLCEHFYKLRLALGSHTLPASGKCKV